MLFFMVPLLYVLYMDLPPASSCIMVAEQVRMIMKAHAFVRVNIGKAIHGFDETIDISAQEHPIGTTATISGKTPQGQIHDNRGWWTLKPTTFSAGRCNPEPADSTEVGRRGRSLSEEPEACDGEENYESVPTPWRPSFSHYLYFMFAPTLVYRENYPRTPRVHWHYVASNFAQVAACVVYAYYIFSRFCFQPFARFGRSENFHLSLRQLVLSGLNLTLPGGLLLLLTFFSFLHCWMNAFAEMMRFGDRLFYKDWWNSTGFSGWYRTWNVVVHDWLYTYIYRDIFLALGRGRKAKLAAASIVFLISAFVHEYILTVVFRFFYPVLFLFFGGFGFLFFFVRGQSRGWNVMLWVQLFIGMGQIICLYSMEWYARRNCEPIFNSWLDFWVPHSWFCTRRMPVPLYAAAATNQTR
ncbi:unnamed protein product [Protopolystoma xenopodis]|uniref:O-acyltransferase n=1 Tax=Protopolystoma xenopodis TaxID=117903 RepID=A0A448WD46_9PLAT|nr:unnamed protein product [Protopolystoma xenopodis]